MQLFKTPNINFMKYKFIALGVTGAVILAGALNIFFGKGLKLGVDFGGGTLIRVVFKSPTTIPDIRSRLSQANVGESVVQSSGSGARVGHEFMIRTRQLPGAAAGQQEIEAHAQQADRVIAALQKVEGAGAETADRVDLNTIDRARLSALLDQSFPGQGADLAAAVLGVRNSENILGAAGNKIPGVLTSYEELTAAGVKPEVVKVLQDKTYLGPMSVVSRETVGPQAGADLRKKATLAVVWSLVGMLIYIGIRFKLEYGVSAIVTLTQDVLMALSVYSFTNREINLPIIAALLTIVGYSINDTVVVFDRVRENLKVMRKESFSDILNRSINQSLGRTIITTGTVFLAVLSLFLFGGKSINDFAFIMLFGSLEGVYSTIYLSCPVVLFWTKLFPGKRKFRK